MNVARGLNRSYNGSMIDKSDRHTWGGVIIFDGVLVLIVVIVAINENLPAAILIGEIM